MKGVATRTPPPLAAIKVPGARRVYLARGPTGFGFRLSTNSKTLDSGYSHYASEVDDGGLAEIAGLKIGDRFLEIDGGTVVSIPHNYIKAVFGKAGINSRPLRCVVCPPNEGILAAIRARLQTDPTDNPPFKPEAPPSRPLLQLGDALPRDADKDGCHLVLVLADGTELSIDAAEADFGGQVGRDGVMLELFHDPTNPSANRAARGGEGRAVLVLLEEGTAVNQAKQCQAAGAQVCILINRKANQLPRALDAGAEDGDRVTIPCINISMRDGISLAKKLRSGQLGATVHPWRAPAYDESDIGTQISGGTDLGAETEMNPGIHVEIDGRDCGFMYAGESEFGNYLPADGMKLEVVMPDDPRAATKLTASEQRRVRGHAVLVERGGLKISQKVLHCEEAGARACVVANTTPGGQAFSIARTEDGGPEDSVTIPTLALGTEDGQMISEAVADGKHVILTLYHILPIEEEDGLPEGWEAEEQSNGGVLYVNHDTNESMEEFPTPEAVAAMRLERRHRELEEREQELVEMRAAQAAAAIEAAAQLAAMREEQERDLQRKADEIEAREQAAQEVSQRELEHEREREESARDDQRRADERSEAAEEERKAEEAAAVAAEAASALALLLELEESVETEREAAAAAEAADAERQQEYEAAERAADAAQKAAEAAEAAVAEAERAEREEQEQISAAIAQTTLSRTEIVSEVEQVKALLAADHSPEAKKDRRNIEYARSHDAAGLLICHSKYSQWHVIRCNLWRVRALSHHVNMDESSELAHNPLRIKSRRTTGIVEHISDVLAETRDKAKRDKRPSEVKIASLKARVSVSHQRLSDLNFEAPDDKAARRNSNPFLQEPAAVPANAPGIIGEDDGNEVTVRLIKDSDKTWGLKLKQTPAGIALKKSPPPECPAGASGVLEAGMVVISVNDVNVEKYTKEELGPHMKVDEIVMVLRRDTTGDNDGAAAAAAAAAAEEEADFQAEAERNAASERQAEADRHAEYEKQQAEEIRREEELAAAADAERQAEADRQAEYEKQQAEEARQVETAAVAAAAAAAAAVAAADAEQDIMLVRIDKRGGQKLGLKIGNKNGTNAVKKVIDGGLASDTPIRAGMVVVSVNGQRCQGLSKDECVGMLSGTGMLEIKLRKMNEDEFQQFAAQSTDTADGAAVNLTTSAPAASAAVSADTVPIGVAAKPAWLLGQLERGEVETILLKKGDSDGRFLVRERQKDDLPVAYGLAVTFRGKATHHKIKLDGDKNLVLGSFKPYPKGVGSKSLAELVEFLGTLEVPDSNAPGWPVRLIRGVRADGSLMAERWTRRTAVDENTDDLGRATPGRAEIEAKYGNMKRLAMVKECRAKGIEYSAVSKDEAGLRLLLIDNDLAAAGISDDANTSLSGSILRTAFSPPGQRGSIKWKSDDEIVDVETIPRCRNGDEEDDQYSLYQCRYAYNPSIEGFTVGEDLAVAPGDILQVYDEGGTAGHPQTAEEKEADPNCWMRGWTQDEREGTFPSSYVSKIIPRTPVQIESYGS